MSGGGNSSYRLGVDIGGTFTDIVLLDEGTGRIRVTKLPSTPDNPAVGLLEGVDWALGQPGMGPGALRHLAHGTTVATNAIIEGKTARTALLVTRGFRDILEIAHQTRPDLFDLFCDKPVPLVPRDRCFEVRERRGPAGEILEPMVEADVEAATAALAEQEVEALAICFLHAYAYPEHEQRAAEIVQARCPDLSISLSSEVLPQFREYLRASTTVVNAALLPVLRRYLDGIRDGLAARRLPPRFYVMQSNGGLLTADSARDKPVYVVESGPAAGVIAAARLAQAGGYAEVISLDMGGTTAKAALIRDGRPREAFELEIGAMASAGRGLTRGRGYPIGTPSLDLVEVGAGGGSVAWVDSGGVLRVGPRSAGAHPGPACYGRGGLEPTVTDANLLLGRLVAEAFLGGAMVLDAEAARSALAPLAESLGVDLAEAALGVLDIANASMVHAIHLVCTQRGYDPRDFVLVAFGGAGPLHANALSKELGIPRTVIPPGPGVTSAVGLLLADLTHELMVTHVQRFDEVGNEELEARWRRFAQEGRAALARQGVPEEQMDLHRALDLRYVGQSYELRIPVEAQTFDLLTLSPPPSLPLDFRATIADLFHREHRRAYGYAAPEEPIELVNVRLRAVGRMPKPALPHVPPQEGPVASAVLRTNRVCFRERSHGVSPRPSSGGQNRLLPPPSPEGGRGVRGRVGVGGDDGYVDCPVYDRYRLGAGAAIPGPAVIVELDSTTVVHPGYGATVDGYGNLVLENL